jgi:hypothetical protein
LTEQSEGVEALPLIPKRKWLGIIIPAINIPLFVLSVNRTITLYLSGVSMNSEDFISNGFVVVVAIILGFVLPIYLPITPADTFSKQMALKSSDPSRGVSFSPTKNCPCRGLH